MDKHFSCHFVNQLTDKGIDIEQGAHLFHDRTTQDRFPVALRQLTPLPCTSMTSLIRLHAGPPARISALLRGAVLRQYQARRVDTPGRARRG